MKTVVNVKKLYLLTVWWTISILMPFGARADEQRPLNILYVVSYFPKLSETFILNQVTGLLDLGHNVYIYAVKKEEALVHDDFYTYQLAKRIIYHERPGRKKKNFFSGVSFDAVLCHFGHRGYLGYELIKKYRIQAPLFTFFHGVDMSTNLDAKPWLYDKLFAYLDLALPISDYWCCKLIGLGHNPEKILVHHMGVDCNKFQYQAKLQRPGESTRFITVARFIEKKGVEYAIQAFAQVAKEYQNIEYILIGDGPLKKAIIELIEQLGISDKVRLMGSCAQKEVIKLVQSAHIYLAPSVTARDNDKEGIPVSMMEAMAMGLPVISTEHSGIPELVQNEITGFLVPERDVESLAEKMQYMIDYPELWPRMGQAGRDWVFEHFNCQKQNNRLISIFREYIDKGH